MSIAIYLRLSQSDGDLGVDGKDESNSIENQRMLLQEYVEAREDLEGEIVEYVDETDIIGLNQNPRHLGVDLVLFSRIQNKFQMNGGVTAY